MANRKNRDAPWTSALGMPLTDMVIESHCGLCDALIFTGKLSDDSEETKAEQEKLSKEHRATHKLA